MGKNTNSIKSNLQPINNSAVTNTITSSNYLNNTISNSNIVTSPLTYTTGYVSTQSNYVFPELISVEIPTIFTISNIIKISNKKLRIEYNPVDERACQLSSSGSVYISEANIYGVYNSQDNYYWNYSIEVEFNSLSDLEKVQVGHKFTNATQWEKKLSISEIVDLVNDPNLYYKFVHKIVESHVQELSMRERILQHKTFDSIYGIGLNKQEDDKRAT